MWLQRSLVVALVVAEVVGSTLDQIESEICIQAHPLVMNSGLNSLLKSSALHLSLSVKDTGKCFC